MLAKSVLVVLLAQKSQFQKIVRLWPSSTRFSSQLLLRRTGFLLAMRRHLSQERCACTAAGGERQMSKCPSKAPARGTRHVVTALRQGWWRRALRSAPEGPSMPLVCLSRNSCTVWSESTVYTSSGGVSSPGSPCSHHHPAQLRIGSRDQVSPCTRIVRQVKQMGGCWRRGLTSGSCRSFLTKICSE